MSRAILSWLWFIFYLLTMTAVIFLLSGIYQRQTDAVSNYQKFIERDLHETIELKRAVLENSRITIDNNQIVKNSYELDVQRIDLIKKINDRIDNLEKRVDKVMDGVKK